MSPLLEPATLTQWLVQVAITLQLSGDVCDVPTRRALFAFGDSASCIG